ncbi:MAG: phospho-sugar mutase [Defluviitaleaceae bacterium]|nr:phospho-sugar mutase [Defluviitaleaceae bacterium]
MDYQKAYESWLADPNIDEATKEELRSIANDPKEIEDRFYRDLEFGTGGLRGVVGAGTNRMNVYTVGKATQGLANYILSSPDYKPGMGVAIAHDSRRMSPEFTQEAALVLCANGIKTYTFDSLRPTPLLSFTVRQLGCIAGIVVTASHNPPEYNGYKVYWSDGAQCTAPRDTDIIHEVQKVEDLTAVKTMSLEAATKQGLFNIVPLAVDDAFVANVKAQSQNPDIIPASDLNIVYTPLHGTGNVLVRRVLREMGFENVFVVKEQELPDGGFPTVAYPNPEDVNAFALAIKLAKEKNADLVVATDPDCDRVGVAVKNGEEYTLLNGNMTGVLLAEYLVTQMKDKATLPARATIISTIVSTNMTRAICERNGVDYMDVLTGFKFFGAKMKEFDETGSHQYIYGFEESYGYLTGTYARDKDAVCATMLICEAAAFYKGQGLSLYDQLQKLYEKYGMYKESAESITLKGVEGVGNIQKIMAALRQNPPQSLAGIPITETRDYQSGVVKNLATGAVTETGLPVSDVLYYAMACDSWACVRPSGTEPKIKVYFGAKLPQGSSMADADAKLAKMAEGMLGMIDEILA